MQMPKRFHFQEQKSEMNSTGGTGFTQKKRVYGIEQFIGM